MNMMKNPKLKKKLVSSCYRNIRVKVLINSKNEIKLISTI